MITLDIRSLGRYDHQSMVFAIKNAALQAFVQAGVFTKLEDAIFLVEGGTRGSVLDMRL